MAIRQIRWQPDTCGCSLVENYDTVTDTKTLNFYEKVCTLHSVLADDNSRYTAMKENNHRKNQVESFAVANLPTDLLQTLPNGTVTYKNGITYNWSWSGTGDTRVLTVSYTGITLSAQKKATWQNFCDTQFGAGKVIIT